MADETKSLSTSIARSMNFSAGEMFGALIDWAKVGALEAAKEKAIRIRGIWTPTEQDIALIETYRQSGIADAIPYNQLLRIQRLTDKH